MTDLKLTLSEQLNVEARIRSIRYLPEWRSQLDWSPLSDAVLLRLLSLLDGHTDQDQKWLRLHGIDEAQERGLLPRNSEELHVAIDEAMARGQLQLNNDEHEHYSLLSLWLWSRWHDAILHELDAAMRSMHNLLNPFGLFGLQRFCLGYGYSMSSHIEREIAGEIVTAFNEVGERARHVAMVLDDFGSTITVTAPEPSEVPSQRAPVGRQLMRRLERSRRR